MEHTATAQVAPTLLIDDPETLRLVAELSKVTGKTPVEAVSKAIRDQFARQQEVLARFNEVQAIGDRCAEIIRESGETMPSQDEIHDWLYEEHGLPR